MIFLRNESLSGGSGGAELTEGLILDLDFNGNYIDKSPAGLVLTGGDSAGTNPPTFVPGRKAGTLCANFNGSQSLRTTSDLPLNSDKVTVSFWMKTTQTGVAIVGEMSIDTNSNNTFSWYINDSVGNSVQFNSRNTGENKSARTGANNGTWKHFVAVIDRTQNGANEILIYENGTLATFTKPASTDNNGNFANNILFIGQRGGAHYGFNGQFQNLQVRNIALTDEQALQLYNSQL